MAIHTCTDCGLVHDVAIPTTNAEVEIARINADAQIRMAELTASADKAVAKTEGEAAVAVAAEEADAIEAAMADQEADEHVVEAINAAAVGLDPVAEDAEPEPAPEPIVIQDTQVNEEAAEPPKPEHHEDHEPKRKHGLGLW